MKGMLESLGYREAPERADADLILFNTCSIREKADERFVSHLHEAKHLKRRDPERIIGVGGCWAQSVKDQVFRQFPFVDVAFGPGQVHKLAEFLTSDSLTAQGYFEFEGFTGHLPSRRTRDFQAWVQISAGCNMRCSFCIVPSTRGREVSRPLEELVAEVRGLGADGVREVTLLGQNVNAFHGEGPDGRAWTLGRLLERLAQIPGIARLRYMTSHPGDVDDSLIAAHRDVPSVMPHLHLPVQSGSDRILAAMNRRHTRADYLRTIERLRAAQPELAFSSDFIVGFPGETEVDFRETLSLVQEIGYAGAYSFTYSPRPGTPAAEMPEQVSETEKSGRLRELQALIERQQTAFNQACVGRTFDVLFEKQGRKSGQLVGRSPYLQAVHAMAESSLIGEIAPVTITAIGANGLFGAVTRAQSHQETAVAMAGA
jgi:tRNA-2-methylthio-N6-dimethylallyladenosine synthase